MIDDDEVVRVTSNLVVVPASVTTDKGEPVQGLQATDFRLEEEGRAQEIDMHERLDDAFPVFPWSATPKGRFVRIVPQQISGRRFHVVNRRP